MANDAYTNKNLRPMLLHTSPSFDSRDFIFELKFDGIRCIAYVEGQSVTLKSRNGNDITAKFPELNAIAQSTNTRCILDGEIVCLQDGKPHFGRVISRNSSAQCASFAQNPAVFVAFDILFCDNKSLLDSPLIERKKVLSDIARDSSALSICRYVEERGKDFFQLAKAQELEGIVAKRKLSVYLLGKRSPDWLKIKNYTTQKLVVCGLIFELQSPKYLILGKYEQGNLEYFDRVFASFDDRTLVRLAEFAKAHPDQAHFDIGCDDVVWIKPSVVVDLSYLKRSASLRHASITSITII